MFMFIAFSLALCFMLQANSPWLDFFAVPWVNYGGLAVAVIGLIGEIIKKGPSRLWHDLFSAGVLVFWYPYWKPFFTEDTPVFFAYALYFVFMSAFIELFFISPRNNIDKVVLEQLQLLAQKMPVKSWMVMLLVLVSMETLDHYMLYPVAMTLLMLRFALSAYLDVGTGKNR